MAEARSLGAAAAAGLLALGTLVSLVLLLDGSLPSTPETAVAFAASHPAAWRAAWLALIPGCAALAFAIGAWSRAVAPAPWGSLGPALGVAALCIDLLALRPLLLVPEAGREVLRLATLLSGWATGLWTLALLVPTLHSVFGRGDEGWAWAAVLGNGALAAAALTMPDSSRWGSAVRFALMAVSFAAVPVMLVRVAFRPPRARRPVADPPGLSR